MARRRSWQRYVPPGPAARSPPPKSALLTFFRTPAGHNPARPQVFGPAPPRYSRDELPSGPVVEVNVRTPAGFTSLAGERSLEALIRGAVEASLAPDRDPRTVLSVVVQVIKDDGSLFAAALNAATMALLDAGVGLVGLPLAACATFQGTTLVLDPSAEEERAGRAHCFLSALLRGSAAAEEVLGLELSGVVEKEDSDRVLAACLSAVKIVGNFAREAMRATAARDA